MSNKLETTSQVSKESQEPTVIIANMDKTDWETLLLEMRLVEG